MVSTAVTTITKRFEPARIFKMGAKDDTSKYSRLEAGNLPEEWDGVVKMRRDMAVQVKRELAPESDDEDDDGLSTISNAGSEDSDPDILRLIDALKARNRHLTGEHDLLDPELVNRGTAPKATDTGDLSLPPPCSKARCSIHTFKISPRNVWIDHKFNNNLQNDRARSLATDRLKYILDEINRAGETEWSKREMVLVYRWFLEADKFNASFSRVPGSARRR